MNVLTIIVSVIFAVFMLLGLKRGLFKTAFKMISMVLALALAYFISPMVSDTVIQRTNVDEYIKQTISNKMRGEVEQKVSEEALSAELTKNEQIQAISEFNIPSFLKDNLIANNHDEMKKMLGVNNFYDYVVTYIAVTVIRAVSFIATTIVIMLLLFIISIVVSVALELPIVGSINKIGGLAFGFCEALLIVWLMFVLFAAMANTKFGINMYNQIGESRLLQTLYDKDIFLNVLNRLYE